MAVGAATGLLGKTNWPSRIGECATLCTGAGMGGVYTGVGEDEDEDAMNCAPTLGVGSDVGIGEGEGAMNCAPTSRSGKVRASMYAWASSFAV